MRNRNRDICIISFSFIFSTLAHAGASVITADQTFGDTGGLATVGSMGPGFSSNIFGDAVAETEQMEQRLVQQKIPGSKALQTMATETERLRNPADIPSQFAAPLKDQISDLAKQDAVKGYQDLRAKLYAENQTLLQLNQDQEGRKIEIDAIKQSLRRGSPEEQHLADVQREFGGGFALIKKQEAKVESVRAELADLMDVQPQTIGRFLALEQTVYARNLAKQAAISGAARVARNGCPLEEDAASGAREINILFGADTAFNPVPRIISGESLTLTAVRGLTLLPVCVAGVGAFRLLTSSASAAEKDTAALSSVSSALVGPNVSPAAGGVQSVGTIKKSGE